MASRSGNRSRLIARFAAAPDCQVGAFSLSTARAGGREVSATVARQSSAESFFDISFPIVRSHATLPTFDNKAPCRPAQWRQSRVSETVPQTGLARPGRGASKRKSAWGSRKSLKRLDSDRNPRKSKRFSWIHLARAWLDLLDLANLDLAWIETAVRPCLPHSLRHVDNPELRPLPAAVAVHRQGRPRGAPAPL